MINNRLYPSRFSDRFYITSLLREAMESIARDYLVKRNGKILLDFGCGTMPYRPIFEKYVTQYLGVDLSGNQIADFYVNTNGKTCLPDEFADVVLSTQVLEHVEQSMQYLRECYRLLKPDGLLILSTHGYWMFHPDPQDLWRWTNDGLKKTINDASFQIVDLRGLMGLASTAVHLLQDALMPKVPAIIKPLFSLIMQKLVSITDRLHSPSQKTKDACVFVVVARKIGKESRY